jgi:type II secretory pathway predicted ATPase ExeA
MNEPEIRNAWNNENTEPARSDGDALRPMGIERKGVDQLFLDYYGLSEQPFGVTPDLRFLYLGAKHRQALDALNFGTELNRGFLTLIAKPGMGKTSLLFQYLEGLRDTARTAFLFQTDCDSTELMRYLLAELGLDGKGMDLPEMRAVLSQVLLGEMEAGRRFVLVIDEAQNLDEKVLESIRLLSNFETPWMKLMQIVLAGQPQLADRLAKPSMIQLRQRVSFAIRIEPFTREEVDLYIDHRLWVAGYKGSPLFSIGARTLLAERSEGIPRIINNMCFCALSFAWAMEQKTIDREMMSDVLADMDPGSPNEKTDLPPKFADEPKQVIPAAQRPPVLTVKEPPARGWLTKVAIAGVVLLALGWTGVHFNFGQRLAYSFDDIATTIKSYFVPTPPRLSMESTTPASSHDPSLDPSQEAPADDKNPGVALKDASGSPRSSPGLN